MFYLHAIDRGLQTSVASMIFPFLRRAITPQSIANCERSCELVFADFRNTCIAIAIGRRLLRLVFKIGVISMNLISDVSVTYLRNTRLYNEIAAELYMLSE